MQIVRLADPLSSEGLRELREHFGERTTVKIVINQIRKIYPHVGEDDAFRWFLEEALYVLGEGEEG